MNSLSEKILFLAGKGDITNRDVFASISGSFSRVTVAKVLSDMVDEGKLIRIGKGRSVRYRANVHVFSRIYSNRNLEEHLVLDELQSQFSSLNGLSENLRSIFAYSFSEMLNNAIEHSGSEEIEVSLKVSGSDFSFSIRDWGIGVFNNIQQKYGLQNAEEAIQELMKGKTTTAPQAHSGEGVFFTSKIADFFQLSSFGYELTIDNRLPDTFVRSLTEGVVGTMVNFQISLATEKHLNDVFQAYVSDMDEQVFDKTSIVIKLFTNGTIYISRSQARRVISNLEKFKHIVLDFKGVPTVGQAFCDEIFRVFKTKNPDVVIEPIHMDPGVSFMVNMALGGG